MNPTPTASFAVKPDGNDTHPEGPWKTLAGARDQLRALRAAGEVSGQVGVILHPGTYNITEVLQFGPEDSHTTYRSLKTGTAIVDGGERLSGFEETTVHGCRAWVLDLPEVRTGHWFFRSLFVNGSRAPRARLPKFSPDRKGVDKTFRIGEIRFPEKRGFFDGDHYFKPRPGDVEDWETLPDAEVVLLHYWVETRMTQPHLDPQTGWLRFARRSAFKLYESFDDRLARYYIDHLYEALTEPGEWYLDRRSGRLTYLPLEGEELNNTEIIAPRVKQFVRAGGHFYNENIEPVDPFWMRPLESLHFEGIVFQHADWYAPPAEFILQNKGEFELEDIPIGGSVQAAVHIPAALELRGARHCHISRSTIRRVGFGGIEIGDGCRHCAAQGNHLEDLGGGGIKVWGAELGELVTRRTGHIDVSDNRIRHIGRVFHQGVGVLLGPVFDCNVLHNEISDTCYTGISCGWSWGFRETISRNNRIEFNRVFDIGQGVLSDMGAIYTLGVQPGTVVRNNVLYNVESHAYGGWGIYPDEGSSHILFENNLVYGTQGAPFRIHYGRELVVRNNVFIGSITQGLVEVGRHLKAVTSAHLMHNLLIGPSPYLYSGGYQGDIARSVRSDVNLIWFNGAAIPSSGNPPGVGPGGVQELSFPEWQRIGQDRNSTIADPLFVNPEKGDFRLREDSPALVMGFRAADWESAGPRIVD